MRLTELQIGRLYPVCVPDDFDEYSVIGVQRKPQQQPPIPTNLRRRAEDQETRDARFE